MLQGNFVKIFNSTQTFKKFSVLKFELILIIGSNKALMEGARKLYRGRQGARGRRVGQGWSRQCRLLNISQSYRPPLPVTGIGLRFTFTNVGFQICLQCDQHWINAEEPALIHSVCNRLTSRPVTSMYRLVYSPPIFH
jgi:hypothetical protein